MAKLADSGVTAVAWHAPNFHEPPAITYFEEEDSDSPAQRSLLRWRSARSIARRARRLASAAVAQRDAPGPGEEDAGINGGDGDGCSGAWAAGSRGGGHDALLPGGAEEISGGAAEGESVNNSSLPINSVGEEAGTQGVSVSSA